MIATMDRSLTLKQALSLLVDIKDWYMTGETTPELLDRVPRDVLQTTDRLTWFEEILHDMACSVPHDDKDEFEEYRLTLLHDLCL